VSGPQLGSLSTQKAAIFVVTTSKNIAILSQKKFFREKCLLNTDCTHITWTSDNLYNGACFLKQASIPPDPLSPRASPFWHGRTSSTCGYFSTKISKHNY